MGDECTHSLITVDLKDVTLLGELNIPENALGLILFSHESLSSRLNGGNNYIARTLQENGLATLFLDLLTDEEHCIYENRFNIELLTKRLIEVTKCIKNLKQTSNLPIGYFGGGTVAAYALRAAAALKGDIAAMVSHCGRPDHAMDVIEKVRTPTLLIVGGNDTEVLEINKQAYQRLQGARCMKIIPNASHLFEENGKLETMAISTVEWFREKINAKTINYVQG